MGIYEELGVRTIINAKGPSTRLSGGFLRRGRPGDGRGLPALRGHRRASGRGEPGHRGDHGLRGRRTSGAAAGLLLGAAACVTGLDPGKMNRLPDTTGMKDEIVMVRSQRNFYDHAIRGAGVRIVESGYRTASPGPGSETPRDGRSIRPSASARRRCSTWPRPARDRRWPRSSRSRMVGAYPSSSTRRPSCPRPTTSAASSPSAPISSRSAGEGHRRATGVRLPGRAAGPHRRRGPPAPGPRRPVGACGARRPTSSTRAGYRAPHTTASAGRARSARKRSWSRGRAAPVRRRGPRGAARPLADPGAGAGRGAGRHPRTSVRLLADRPWREIPQVELALGPEARGTALALIQVLEAGSPPVFADPARLDEQVVVLGTSCLREAILRDRRSHPGLPRRPLTGGVAGFSPHPIPGLPRGRGRGRARWVAEIGGWRLCSPL